MRYVADRDWEKRRQQNILEKVGYTRIRFADRLKKMLREGLGIPDEYIDGYKKNESCEWLCGRTARHAMVTLGYRMGTT